MFESAKVENTLFIKILITKYYFNPAPFFYWICYRKP